MKKLLNKIKWYLKGIQSTWFFLRTINSPFIPLTFKIYFGKIIHGNPYFLPRRWVKLTKQDCIDAAEKAKLNKRLISVTHEPDYYKNHTKPVPVKYFQFKVTSLGWKTKWDDYRFEWSPSISVVILGKQLFIPFYPKSDKGSVLLHSYWEAFLTYHYDTDRTKSTDERLLELFDKYSCTWKGNDGSTDYYYDILKPKYLKIYERKN